MGEFADMGSRSRAVIQPGVAALASRARRNLRPPTRVALTRAAHLHDIGRASVVLDIWDKPGPLTERSGSASACTPTTPSASWRAWKRWDRGAARRWPTNGWTAAATPAPAAVGVPAASAPAGGRRRLHAMTRPRAPRAALPAERAAALAARRGGSRTFDAAAVDAVLAAAGRSVPRQRRDHRWA